MKITGITKNNIAAFISLLPGSAVKTDKNLIRIGVVDDGGKAAGALSARADQYSIDILSLYVFPDKRGNGYGSALMDAFEGFFEKLDPTAVSREYVENDSLNDFFLHYGYDLFPGKNLYKTTVGDILRSPMYKKIKRAKRKTGYTYVSKLSVMDRKAFDIAVQNADYDPEWSTARIENGKYTGCMLCNTGNGSINVIWTDSVDLSPDDFRQHTALMLDKIKETYDNRRDVEIFMTFERPDVVNFIKRSFGGYGHLKTAGRYINAIKIV